MGIDGRKNLVTYKEIRNRASAEMTSQEVKSRSRLKVGNFRFASDGFLHPCGERKFSMKRLQVASLQVVLDYASINSP